MSISIYIYIYTHVNNKINLPCRQNHFSSGQYFTNFVQKICFKNMYIICKRNIYNRCLSYLATITKNHYSLTVASIFCSSPWIRLVPIYLILFFIFSQCIDIFMPIKLDFALYAELEVSQSNFIVYILHM